MRTLLSAICLLAVLGNMPAPAQRVSQTAPLPNRNLAAPGSQRPPSDHPESAAGTIEGFVYWDAGRFHHVPTLSCSGLAVTVAVGSSSGGPLTAYTPLATLTNNFAYVGQVKEFLTGGRVNVYDVCTYGYDRVPVGPDLQVKLTVTQPGAFSPVAVPQFATLGPIKIINARCNTLPNIANPTVSDLLARWSSCQNVAYNVNFAMHIAPRDGSALTPVASGSQGAMLSNPPQRGMLAAAGSPAPLLRTNGGTPGSRGSTPSAVAMATPASRVELNPQPLPPRTTAASGTAAPGMMAAVNHPRTILSSACTVSQLQLRFRTGNDDLRGGQNNLSVEVHFSDGTVKVADNVNHGASWGNNSTNTVTIPLTQPVAPNQIQQIRLIHQAHGGYTPPNAGQGGLMTTPAGPALAPIYAAQGVQSEDNWDMAEFQAFGLGSGINLPIASFGSHRFTGSDPSLDIHAQPGIGCPAGNQVDKISFTFHTGDDDLRGGNDNLNITIHFADGTTQFEPNVNHGERWPDGSTKGAEVLLNRPATIDQIRSITLSTTFLGGSGGDNWNMASMQADASVSGTYHTIATSGFHRFSADWSGQKAREITIAIHAIH